ncbi:MAG: DUF4178 domain-containing protein [Fibrobacterota bacterium]|nr:DUF4178 domain-containing protein [Chitinispirillaceae bacterium]
MPEKKHQCPSCGAELISKHIYVKKMVCSYCGQIAIVNANGLVAANGNNNPLLDYSSVLRLNMKASANKVGFEVRGRIRFKYASGYWDEWAVILQGAEEKNVWIQEDDGALVAFTESENNLDYSTAAQYAIGETFKVGDMQIFITEKGAAEVNGYEGEIVSENDLSSTITYWDGILIGSGRIVSIECVNGQYTAFEGRPLPVDCISDIDVSLSGSQKETLLRTSLSPVKQITCASCGAALSLFRNTSEFYACNYCQSVLDIKSKDAQLLEKLDISIPVRSFITLGYCIKLNNKMFVAVGRTRWRNNYYELNSSGGYDYETWEYDEWLFAAEDGESVYICEDAEGFTLSEELYPQYPNVIIGSEMRTFDSNWKVAAIEYGESEVVFFEGESTYHIHKGDRKKFAEYRVRSINRHSVECRLDKAGNIIEIEFFSDRGISSGDLRKNASQATIVNKKNDSSTSKQSPTQTPAQSSTRNMALYEPFAQPAKKTMAKPGKIVRKLPYSFNRKLFLFLCGLSIIACIILAANASRFGGVIFSERVNLCDQYYNYPKNIIPCYQVPLFTCNNSVSQTPVVDTTAVSMYATGNDVDSVSEIASAIVDTTGQEDTHGQANSVTQQVHEVFCAETPYFNVDPSMKICEISVSLPLGLNDKSLNADISIINSSGIPVLERNVEFFVRNSYYSSSESLEKFNEKILVDKFETFKIKLSMSSVYTDFNGTQLDVSFMKNRVQSEFFTLAVFFFSGLGLIFMRKRRVKV